MDQFTEYNELFPPDIMGIFLNDTFSNVSGQESVMSTPNPGHSQKPHAKPHRTQSHGSAITDSEASPLFGVMQLVHEEPPLPKSPRNSRSTSTKLHRVSSCETCFSSSTVATTQCKKERRRQQNRMSQQKFREKKEAKLQKASEEISVLQARLDTLRDEKRDLHKVNKDLRMRIEILERSQSQASCSQDGLSPSDVGLSPYELSDVMSDSMFRSDLTCQIPAIWLSTSHSDIITETSPQTMPSASSILDHWMNPHPASDPSSTPGG